MKKFLILYIVFLISCGYNLNKEDNDILIGSKENNVHQNISEGSNTGNISVSKENIKQICDTAIVGEKLYKLEKSFGPAILLSETDLGEGEISTSYYYGQVGGEICMILVSKGEITSKNYINI